METYMIVLLQGLGGAILTFLATGFFIVAIVFIVKTTLLVLKGIDKAIDHLVNGKEKVLRDE